MANKSIPTDVEMLSALNTAIAGIAETVALPILQGKFFDVEGHAEVSKSLRKLQELVGGMVAEHDKLADETGNTRLVGKRGRKSGETKVVTTADDAINRLLRR